jgi:hypothetical protein
LGVQSIRKGGDHTGTPGRPLLIVHAGVALAPVALFVVMDVTYRGGGANIGQGLVVPALLGAGLPWSLPFLIDP